MKRLSALGFCIVFFAGMSGYVYAQSDPVVTSSETPQVTPINPRSEVRDATAATRMDVSEDTVAEEMTGVTDRASQHFANVLARFNAAIFRVENISERINSRIEILSTTHDITEAQTYVDEALDHVANAEAALERAQTQFDAVLASENPRAIFATVKNGMDEAKEELLAAHEMLISALREIKTLSVDDKAAAPASGSAVPKRPAGEATVSPAAVTTIAPAVEM